MTELETILRRLDAIDARHAEMMAKLDALTLTRGSLSRDDRTRLEALLPAIVGRLGSDNLHTAKEIAEDESAALRVVLKGASAKQLGKLFRRAEGQRIGRYEVRDEGTENNATLWRVLVF